MKRVLDQLHTGINFKAIGTILKDRGKKKTKFDIFQTNFQQLRSFQILQY